jgi:AcrR family transcriptional regulator
MLQVVKTVERRTVLLDKIVDVLLAEGISDLSLRPLAKAVGTSARLLIYHFGSKEKLLTDALEQVRQRIEASLRILAEKQGSLEGTPSLREFLLLFWYWAMRKPNQRYFRLLFEIDGLALQNRARFPARFWGAGFARWRRVFETEFGQPSDKNGAATSTFQLAALHGLLHDFLFTGDRKRTTAALHRLVETISVNSVAPAKRIKASA